MGLDVGLILSDDRHYDLFVCAICQNLIDLDGLVTTASSSSSSSSRSAGNKNCSHCFCKACLQMWLQRSTRCPQCNCDLSLSGSTSNNNHNNSTISSYSVSSHSGTMMIGKQTVMVQPLSSCQPLAHRLLQRVLVKCPLNSHAKGIICDWKGDYGDLETHLLSRSAHNEVQPEQKKRQQESSSVNTSADVLTVHAEDSDEENASTISEDESNDNKTTMFPTATTPDHSTTTQGERKQFLAVSLKEQANSKFESQHFKEAISLYTKAIEVLQQSGVDDSGVEDEGNNKLLATLCSNRAATQLSIRNYEACAQDCFRILSSPKLCQSIDGDKLAKVYVRISRAYIQLGQLHQAKQFLKEGLFASIPPKQKSILQKSLTSCNHYIKLEEQGRTHLKNQRFVEAKTAYSTLLKEGPSVISFLLGASQADLRLGLTDSALRLTKMVLLQHAQNPTAYWIRGQAVFAMGDTDHGLKLQQEALRLDPDSSQIKDSYKRSKQVNTCMKNAEQCMFRRDFPKAVEIFTECIGTCGHSIAPKTALYATFHTRRAEAYVRLKDYPMALKDCAKVIYSHEDYIPAILVRFKAYHGLEQHEIALEEVQELLQKYPSDSKLRAAYDTADFLYRKSRRVDYYQLLGVPSIASEMEIKKAYKRKALEYHPDKHSQDQQAQAQAQKKFQQLGEGLEVLCNEFQRDLYDKGYDIERIRERVEAANQAANNPHNHRRYGNHHHGW